MKLAFLPALFVLTTLCSPAAVPDWTWMANDNSNTEFVRPPGVQGPPNQIAPHAGASMWSDNAGNLFMFGGYGYSAFENDFGLRNDLWRYSISENLWFRLQGDAGLNAPSYYGTLGLPESANTPGARQDCAEWTDASGNLYLFGGYDGSRRSDLWKWDSATTNWAWIKGSQSADQPGTYGTQGVESADALPGARSDSAVWRTLDGTIWLFGGQGFGSGVSIGWLNDLWKYNPTTGNWTWVGGSQLINQTAVYGTQGVAAAGNIPGAREGSATWVDTTGNLWLFGGSVGNSFPPNTLSDLWKYSPQTNTWTWVKGSDQVNQPGTYGTKGAAAAGNKPGSHFGSAAWVDRQGRLLLFGGGGYAKSSVGTLNDLWAYDPETGNWTWEKGSDEAFGTDVRGTLGVPDPANTPIARYMTIGVTDSVGSHWLYNGSRIGSDLCNDLWKLGSPIPTVAGTVSYSEKLQEKLVCNGPCQENSAGSYQLKCGFQLAGNFVANMDANTSVAVRIGNVTFTKKLSDDPAYAPGSTQASFVELGNVAGKQKPVLTIKLTWKNGAVKMQLKGVTPAEPSPVAATLVDGPIGTKACGADIIVDINNSNQATTRFARQGLPLTGKLSRKAKLVDPTVYHLDNVSLKGAATVAP